MMNYKLERPVTEAEDECSPKNTLSSDYYTEDKSWVRGLNRDIRSHKGNLSAYFILNSFEICDN